MTFRNPVVRTLSMLSRAGLKLWRGYLRILGCYDVAE